MLAPFAGFQVREGFLVTTRERNTRGAKLVIILVCALMFVACGQQPSGWGDRPAPKPARAQGPASPPIDPAQEWRQAAERVTTDLVSDEWKIKGPQHALLLAQICAPWWKVDRVRARAWCQQAAEEVSLMPAQETVPQRRERVGAAREVLTIVGPLDETMRRQVTAALSSPASRTSVAGDRWENARALADAARADGLAPGVVAQLISEAIEIAPVGEAVWALEELRPTESQRADDLFQQTITLLKGSPPDGSIVISWYWVVHGEDSDLPPAWRTAILDYIANVFVRPASEGAKRESCSYSGNVQDVVAQYPEPQRTQFQAALDACFGGPRKDPWQDLKTSDDFLQAAENAKNLGTRLSLKLRAASVAEGGEDNADRALEIIDSVSQEDLERAGYWPWIRNQVSVRAILKALGERDVTRVIHFADRVPNEWQLGVDVEVLEKSEGKGRGILELTRHAERALRSYQAAEWLAYVRFVNCMLDAHSPQIQAYLRDAMLKLDSWKPMERAHPALDERIVENSALLVPWFRPALADLPREMLIALGKGLRTDRVRAGYQIRLLRLFLTRYNELAKPAEPSVGASQ